MRPGSEPDDSRGPDRTQEIVRRAQAGGSSSFRELYERTAPSLLAWAHLRLGRNGMVAGDLDDLLQEVWLRALEELSRYDALRSSFRAWIFGIAKNVLYETWREGGRRELEPASAERSAALANWPDVATTIRTRLARGEALELVLRKAESLDPLDRKLLLHCGFEDMSCVQAARQLGIEAEAATKRWQRLRARLAQRELEDLLDLHGRG